MLPLNLRNNTIGRRIEGYSLNALNNKQYITRGEFVNCNYVTNHENICDKGNITILSFNIRSMKTNFSSFQAEVLQPNSFDIFGLCETRLSEDTEKLYPVPNYNFYATNVCSDMGGVCLYVKNTIASKVISKFCIKTDHFESIFIECMLNKKVYVIGMCYRRPGTPFHLFQDKLSNILEQITSNCIIMGDFNADLFKESESASILDFANNLYEYKYSPMITKPTRVQNRSATLLDQIWVNFEAKVQFKSIIIFSGITDHFPTVFYLDERCNDINTKQITYRKKGEICDEQFKHALDNSQINDIMLINDVDTAFKTFNDMVYQLYDEAYPLISKKIRLDIVAKPWLTLGIKQSIKTKNKLYKSLLKNLLHMERCTGHIGII